MREKLKHIWARPLQKEQLEWLKFNAFVSMKYNLLHERKKGDNYDYESNDEWIAESENPALPMDIFWMDMHSKRPLKKGVCRSKKEILYILFLIIFIFFIILFYNKNQWIWILDPYTNNLLLVDLRYVCGSTKIGKKKKQVNIANETSKRSL